jgi:hypothetical protein
MRLREATLVAKTRVCDFEFVHLPSARRAVFIDARRNQVRPPSGGPALRQEGHVYRCQEEPSPPSARRAMSGLERLDEFYKNMALLAEGGRVSSQVL